MNNYKPRVVRVETLKDAEEAIKGIGSDPQSIDIMAPKTITKIVKFENVMMQDAIIIKQDMLSVGGEVAIPKDAFEVKSKTASILVIGTIKQMFDLIEKLNRHYPRIQSFAESLTTVMHQTI